MNPGSEKNAPGSVWVWKLSVDTTTNILLIDIVTTTSTTTNTSTTMITNAAVASAPHSEVGIFYSGNGGIT